MPSRGMEGLSPLDPAKYRKLLAAWGFRKTDEKAGRHEIWLCPRNMRFPLSGGVPSKVEIRSAAQRVGRNYAEFIQGPHTKVRRVKEDPKAMEATYTDKIMQYIWSHPNQTIPEERLDSIIGRNGGLSGQIVRKLMRANPEIEEPMKGVWIFRKEPDPMPEPTPEKQKRRTPGEATAEIFKWLEGRTGIVTTANLREAFPHLPQSTLSSVMERMGYRTKRIQRVSRGVWEVDFTSSTAEDKPAETNITWSPSPYVGTTSNTAPVATVADPKPEVYPLWEEITTVTKDLKILRDEKGEMYLVHIKSKIN